MDLSRVKYSGSKIVSHLDLWAGITQGDLKQKADCHNFKVFQWNTGGLNQAKKTELHKILKGGAIDVLCAGSLCNRREYRILHFKNYHLNFLSKSRQTASGIFIGTCKPLKHVFSIIKRVIDADKVEIIKLNVWKSDNYVKIFGIYNHPQKNPALILLDVL
jgi:hypothetical protein